MASLVKAQKLLWHLTDLNNLESILKYGLLSRKDVLTKIHQYSDIADSEIIAKRKELNLLGYVPFHFFVNNPFDGKVLKENPDKKFCYISIKRDFASANGFKVLTKHPLSPEAELLPYKQGFDKIDWDILETRNYKDDECKSVCMAEALALGPISYKEFVSIAVCNKECESKVKQLVEEIIGDGVKIFYIDVEPTYFSARKSI